MFPAMEELIIAIRPAMFRQRCDLVPDWGNAVEHEEPGCLIHPMQGEETEVDNRRRNTVITWWVLSAPREADLRAAPSPLAQAKASSTRPLPDSLAAHASLTSVSRAREGLVPQRGLSVFRRATAFSRCSISRGEPESPGECRDSRGTGLDGVVLAVCLAVRSDVVGFRLPGCAAVV